VKRDPAIRAVIADIENLPFENNSADFAFSINVFHHLEGRDAQKRAFDSVSRVLKPDGKFYLHEMNVHNFFFKVYMNYFFPLVKTIDEGIELWIDPALSKAGSFVSNKIIYFTFIPEFAGRKMMKTFEPLERRLENSSLAKYSAHYFRVFENIKS
jgi:SAM-dependent methyltransferase